MTESEQTGTFLVTAADEESAVLKDVESGQVHALSSNPGVSKDEAIRGTVAPDPPMNVSWQLIEIESRWELSVHQSAESPTTNSKEIADERGDGELVRTERAGRGEIHILSVPEDLTEQAVEDVLADREGLLSRAARLDVNRVEIRSAPGVVAVRYMP